ncbi:hypothetical protein LTR41_002447 [Exophiala xenobiotica]|nr:hypothetical protein LTR41_002447 [Exophiala xenobiotica]
MFDLVAKLAGVEQFLDEILTSLNTRVAASTYGPEDQAQNGEPEWAPTLRDVIPRYSKDIQRIREQIERDSRFHRSLKRTEGPVTQCAATVPQSCVQQASHTMAKRYEQRITTVPEISRNVIVSSPSLTRVLRNQEENPGGCIDSTRNVPSLCTPAKLGSLTSDNIPHRLEHGIIVLMPSKSQYRDMALLRCQAESLGARKTGVFKYVLPEDLELDIQATSNGATQVSKFGVSLAPNGSLHISRTQHTEMLEMKDLLDRTDEPVEPGELADILEQRLTDPAAIARMQYCTDMPARTVEDRLKLGLPAQSPIWPLKGNEMRRTKCSIPGLHWPFAYRSGMHGSVCSLHEEYKNLISLNCLYYGRKLWQVIAPGDSHLIENEVKRWKCSQKVRHAARYIPRSALKALGASFVTFVQGPREVVGVFGDAYHEGGTCDITSAEAVNYGATGWNTSGSIDCNGQCPGHPIPNRLLEFRKADEPQYEQGYEPLSSLSGPLQAQDRQQDGQIEPNTTASHVVIGAKPLHGRKGPTARATSARHPRTSIGSSVRSTAPSARKTTSLLTKRKSTVDHSRLLEKKRIIGSQRSVSQGLQEVIIEMEKMEKPLRTSPSLHSQLGVSPQVLKLVMAISSRAAFFQFHGLVGGARDRDTSVMRVVDHGDLCTRLVQRVQGIVASERRSVLAKFMVRIHQVMLAEDIASVNDGRLRTDPLVIKKVLKKTGWTRSVLNSHLTIGRKWKRLCSGYEGLLCFIFLEPNNPFNISPSQFLDMDESDLRTFHHLLENDEYIAAVCLAGKAFQKTLNSTVVDVEFMWESRHLSLTKLKDLAEQEVLSLIKQFPTITENIIDHESVWPRPDEWPKDWPWPEPMWVDPRMDQCEICHNTKCDCIQSTCRIMPRIKDYGAKGRGLQAVASVPGGLAYKEGDIIGELVAVLKPLQSHTDGWSLEVKRKDLPLESEVTLKKENVSVTFMDHNDVAVPDTFIWLQN